MSAEPSTEKKKMATWKKVVLVIVALGIITGIFILIHRSKKKKKAELIRLIILNKELLGPMGETQATEIILNQNSIKDLQSTIDGMKATAASSPGMAWKN